MADLKTNLLGFAMNSPIIGASGTVGYGVEYEELADFTKIGGISTMIQMAAAQQDVGLYLMLFVMMGIMAIATIVTGSGNSAFFAFSPLLPEAAASVGYNTMALVVPVQLAASLARPMSPISGVIIAVSGIAGLTPIELIRRTIPVMVLGMIVNVIAAQIFL